MDISATKHEEIDYPDINVHRLPGGRQPVHEDYGLWICMSFRKSVYAPVHNRKRPRCFEFYGISHLLKGRGFYWEPGSAVTPMRTGDAVIVCPGHVHAYGGNRSHYTEDCMGFAGPVADRLQQYGIIRNGVIHCGSARRLLPIIELAQSPTVDAQIGANIALQELLMHLHLEREEGTKTEAYRYIHELTEHLQRSYGESWSVTRMAEYCNLSPSRFRVVFQSVTGVTPKAYLDRLRIQLAAEALVQNDDAIGAIANRFGFKDPFQFSRRFKAVTGHNPTNYRHEMRLTRG